MDSVSFNTFNFNTMASMMGKSEIQPHVSKPGEFDPTAIFKKQRQENEAPLGFSPPDVIQYNPEDVKELEEYCKKRGIIGVNFGRMSPKTVLNMLKSKNGESVTGEGVSNNTSKRILHG